MKKLRIMFVMMAIIFAFYGCKKLSANQEMQSQKIQRFFATKGSINPAVQRVIDDLREKNTLTGFVENLISKQGFPVWNKAKVNIIKHNIIKCY
jgi:hypothetical protein